MQKRKFENLTTLDQVMPFCGHCVQCGVCDHHIPLGKIGLKVFILEEDGMYHKTCENYFKSDDAPFRGAVFRFLSKKSGVIML